MSDQRPNLRTTHRELAQRVSELTPPDDDTGRIRRGIARAEAMGVLWLFEINSRLIGRWCGHLPGRWAPSRLDWAADLEAAWPEIREEMDAYLAQGTMPHTAEVSGLDPDSDEGRASVPADRGAWRNVVLQFFGEWIDENCVHFPRTVAALSGIRGMTSIGFTALDAHSHIASHVGPNRGALRYMLPIITPGPPGACRLRLGEELIEWHEGASALFDLSVNHEAWNDSDAVRVLLGIEVPAPLPLGLRTFNRVVQASYQRFPSYRHLASRVRRLALERDDAIRDGHVSPRWMPTNDAPPPDVSTREVRPSGAAPGGFGSPDLQERFDRDGFVRVPLLDPAELESLRSQLEALDLAVSVDFAVSTVGRSEAENRAISEAIVAVVQPALQRFCQGYTAVGGAFLAKAQGGEEVRFHQDWNTVDERSSTSISTWIPLVDTDLDTGALMVIPGSHVWFTSFRSPTLDMVEVEIADIPKAVVTPVPLQAGEAIIYDARLFHASTPNMKLPSRPVVTVRFTPEGGELVMCTRSEAAPTYELLRVSDSAFFRGHEISMDPALLDEFVLDRSPVMTATHTVSTDDIRRRCEDEARDGRIRSIPLD